MFIHLHLHSPYSFLDGASEIETLVQSAASHGMPALALTDHDSLSAAVKFQDLCSGYGIKPIFGAELTMEDESHLTLLARNRKGYANLCRLITLGYTHGGRLTPHVPWAELPACADGLICLSGCRKGLVPALLRNHRYEDAVRAARHLCAWFGRDGFYLEMQNDRTPDSTWLCREIAQLADYISAPVVATNNVHYAERNGYIAHDILRCVSAGITIATPHEARPLNSEQFLKSPGEMAELFKWRPEAITNSVRIAGECEPALPDREDITPGYPAPAKHADATAYLRYLIDKGAGARYRPLTEKTKARIEHELAVITRLGFVDYFLLAWSTALWARRQGIRCAGRGSAADSCVAYCLRLTDVDVISRDLPFARFLCEGKVPDIDMDFPADRRDEVFQHLIDTYGSDHTSMVCTFSTYRSKAAVRDVGKALALPTEALSWFSDHLSHFTHADQLEAAFEKQAELKQFVPLKRRFQLLFDLCARIADFPRHIGTHSSGMVISRVPLNTIAPLRPSARGLTQIWELDKDDAETIGAIKLDILSLRTLSAVDDAETAIRRADPRFSYERIPDNDPDTYKMMRAGEAVGSFQFESSAQLALATSLHPQHFEDLVASVALIRPGPVRGDAVQRFVACRNGWMRADCLHPSLRPILQKTYGAIVFQEQAIQVFAEMMGVSEPEADRIRKSLTKHARRNTMHELRDEFVRRALSRHSDLDAARANRLFDMLEGWSGYGFTEGHAASFAQHGYRTAFLVEHHPAPYFAGMMSNQPMGYYSANSLAAEARRRGVGILPVDINASEDRCAAQGPDGIRLGLRLVMGLRDEDIQAIVAARSNGEFAGLIDFCVRAPIHRDRLENLILCGAFDSLHEHRRGLLWRLEETVARANTYRGSAGSEAQPVLDLAGASSLPTPVARDIPDFSPWDRYMWTWRVTGVCAECHVFAWLREALCARRVLTTYTAKQQPQGTRVTVAGLNIRPHRPPTKSGKPVLFTSIEDEFGLLQAVCSGRAIETCTPTFLTSVAVLVRGVIQWKGTGACICVELAQPLRIQDFLQHERPAHTAPPVVRTYVGTMLSAGDRRHSDTPATRYATGRLPVPANSGAEAPRV